MARAAAVSKGCHQALNIVSVSSAVNVGQIGRSFHFTRQHHRCQFNTYQEAMSEFWVRKIKTYFRFVDLNGDGELTKTDYEEFGKRFTEIRQLNEEDGNAVKSQVMEAWSLFTNGNVGVTLSEELFVELMKTQAFKPGFAESIAKILDTSFSIVDADADGSIDLNELALFYEAYGLDRSVAPASFNAIDADGDGLITKEEFSSSGVAFFTGEDEEHPSKLLWGPLI